MNAESEKVYKQILAKVIIKAGALVDSEISSYGWIANDWRKGVQHIRSCGYDVIELNEHFQWTEFAGTFAEGDNWKYGMQMTVTCTCGAYTDRQVRWDGRVADAIRTVLELSE